MQQTIISINDDKFPLRICAVPGQCQLKETKRLTSINFLYQTALSVCTDKLQPRDIKILNMTVDEYSGKLSQHYKLRLWNQYGSFCM